MSEKLKEALSAVIDGEADEFELRRVLDEIGKDAALARSWERYHLIGAVMRGEHVAGSISMRERVWAEASLAQVPAATDAKPERTQSPGSVRAGMGRWIPAAVAATVAVAVIVGFLSVGEVAELTSPVVADRTEVPDDRHRVAGQGALALNTNVTVSDQTRTDAYMVRHFQQLGMNQAGIGFARMVAYERE